MQLFPLPPGMVSERPPDFWIPGQGFYDRPTFDPSALGRESEFDSWFASVPGPLTIFDALQYRSLAGFNPRSVNFEFTDSSPDFILDFEGGRTMLRNPLVSEPPGGRIYLGASIAEALCSEPDQRTLWWFLAKYGIREIIFAGTVFSLDGWLYFIRIRLGGCDISLRKHWRKEPQLIRERCFDAAAIPYL